MEAAATQPAPRPLASRRALDAVNLLAGALALEVALFTVWLVSGWGSAAQREVVGNVLDLPAYAIAAALILVSARRLDGRGRLGWGLAACALLAMGAGSALWAYAELVTKTQAFPSVADVAYLAFTPLMAAAIVMLPHPRMGKLQSWALVLEVGIVLASASAFAWRYLFAPVLAAPSNTLLEKAISLAYPSFDLVLFSLLVFYGLRRSGRLTASEALVGGGLGLFVCADVAFALLSSGDAYWAGHPIDLLWVWGVGAIGLAAVFWRRQDERLVVLDGGRARSLPVTALPYGAILLALALVVIEYWRPSPRGYGIIAGAVIAVLLVVARQVLTLIENTGLNRSLRLQAGALAESEARFRSLVQNGSDIITVLAADGRVKYNSPSLTRLLGYAPEELQGEAALTRVHPDDQPRVQESLGRVAHELHVVSDPYRYRNAAGEWRWMETIATNLLDDPSIAGIVLNSRDVTERKRADELVAFQATHDALTGLPNRRLFAERLEQAIAGARPGEVLSVAFMDLDRFKRVNDTYGHEAGDSLLKQVAGRLRTALRDEDTVARVSGDEFAMLLSSVDGPDGAERAAERVIECLREPFRLGNQSVIATGSAGLSLFPAHGGTPEELLRNADSAMYAAKRAGRNAARLFTTDLGQEAAARRALERDMRHALERGEFKLVYQPQVEFATGRVRALEALLRWQHPTLGLVPPSSFIPIAEETGHIRALGAWVLAQACRDCRNWQVAGQRVPVAVNVSALQFARGDFLNCVAEALGESHLESTLLEIELTESAFLADLEESRHQMLRLRGIGVSIAVDDFGVGHAGLNYLRQLPIDVLKVDRSLGVLDGARGANPILRAVLLLAREMGLTVIAEGIETTEQRDLLVAEACAFGQGFLFARPMPAENVTAYLAGAAGPIPA